MYTPFSSYSQCTYTLFQEQHQAQEDRNRLHKQTQGQQSWTNIGKNNTETVIVGEEMCMNI